MKKLFVSYSRDDKEIVHKAVSELRTFRFDVWVDTDAIIPGKQFSTEISQAIADCDFFILFVSSSSIKSDFIRREVDVAHEKDKNIIPIRLEDVDIPAELNLQLAGIQRIEYNDPKWMSWLLVALGNHESKSPSQGDDNDASVKRHQDKKESVTKAAVVDLGQLPMLIPNHILDIFRQEYIKPKECDEVSEFLRSMAKSISLSDHDLSLQFSLKKSIVSLATRVESFRKICEPVTIASDLERINILKSLEKISHYSPG